MNDTDRENMLKAIAEAEQCRPKEARIPIVGAVIALGKVVLSKGHRGTGHAADDLDGNSTKRNTGPRPSTR